MALSVTLVSAEEEVWNGEASLVVAKTVEAFSKIADGEFDHIAEQAFFNIGGLEDLERNWARIQKEIG